LWTRDEDHKLYKIEWNSLEIKRNLCVNFSMMDWYEPRDFKEWAKRLFAIRHLVLILFILSVFISELRFDWLEQTVGSYLVTTNSNRPESGAIWEIGHRTITARQTLDQIVTDRQFSQREARGATTFTQMALNILPNQGVMLSSEHFRKLYLTLPQTIAHKIASPFEILRLFSDGSWVRTYLEKAGDGLKIYLLNTNNRVLRELKIPLNLIQYIERVELALTGTLEDLPTFKNRIYSADRFFAALESLPEEDLRSVVSQPEMLLSMPGHIVRVGISDEAVSGFIELGFEIEDGIKRKVILLKGREWAVWMLRSCLEEKELELNTTSDSQSNWM